MLNQETKDKLVALGFDVSKLEEAVKSDSEQSLDVPSLRTEAEVKGLFTEEEKNQFGQNRFNEGKEAMSEIKAKELKSKFGIEIEGKDLDKVVEAIAEAKAKEAAEGNTEWMDEKKNLQSTISELQNKLSEETNKSSEKLFKFEIRNKLLSKVPKDIVLSPEQVALLYESEHQIINKDGRAIVQQGGKTLKDKVENPLDPETHFSSWLDAQSFRTVKGREEDDNDGGRSTNGKFKSISDFKAYCDKEGKDSMSDEMQRVLKENKAENFAWE